MRKTLLFLFIAIIAGTSAHAQAFNLKELLTLSGHNSSFFHDYVTDRGYTYEESKYDEKNEYYSYVFLDNIADDLREITYTVTSKGATITYATTDSADYDQVKKQLDLLQFRFVKYVDKQEQGRSVLMIIYTDGNIEVDLYNSYIEDEDHALVKALQDKGALVAVIEKLNCIEISEQIETER